MSDEFVVYDEMIDAQLNEISTILNISIDDLIDRYVKRELFTDDYYVPPVYTREEVLEMGRRAVEKDKKRGIPPAEHDFSVFVNRWSK